MRSVCRACLAVDNLTQQFDWYAPIEDMDENLSYMECFQSCTHLIIKLETDTFAKVYHLCRECANELKNAHKFIRKAESSDAALRLECVRVDTINELKPFECITLENKETDTLKQSHDSLGEALDIKIEEPLIDEGVVPNNDADILPHQAQKKNKAATCNNVKPKAYKLKTSGRNRLIRLAKRTTISKVQTDATESEQVVCEICSKSLLRAQLKKHISYHNRGGLLCKSCPRIFKDLNTLNKHELIHETNRERKFTCEQCDRKFYTHITYKNHLKTHDSSRVALYTCDKCGKSFMSNGSLTLHKQKHAGGTLECNICQKRYVRIIDLQAHLRIHTGDLPYKCTKCDKGFTMMSSLNRHSRQHDGMRYKCNVCGKEYNHHSSLRQHVMGHTGFPVKCSICDKGFPDIYKTRRHMRGVHKLLGADEMDGHIIKVRKTKERVEEVH